jgi:hypothetical protein
VECKKGRSECAVGEVVGQSQSVRADLGSRAEWWCESEGVDGIKEVVVVVVYGGGGELG